MRVKIALINLVMPFSRRFPLLPLLVVVTALLVAPFSAFTSHAGPLSELRRSIASLWGQKSQKQHAARVALVSASATGQRAEALHDRLEATQRLLLASTEQYYDSWRRMRRTEAQLIETRHRVQIVTTRYKAHQKLFGRRLAAMQKHGAPSYLQVILGSQSLSDLTRRTAFFQALAERDSQLQADLKADRLELERGQNALMEQWDERNHLQLAANRQRERIAGAEQDQQAMMRRLRHSRAAQIAYAQAQEQSSNEIGSMIGSLEAQRAQIISSYEAQAAAQRRARSRAHYAMRHYWHRSAQRVRLVSAEYNGHFRTPQLAPMPIEALLPPNHVQTPEGGGEWEMPVHGRLSSRFGIRFHPILRRRKLHTGEDIAASYGTPIRAAASGRVLWAGWKTAYGNTVIVDNGKGVTTLYGHASKLGVKPGQPVKAGEYIGNVGSTGLSTGAHLHFEVRRNGQPVDPRGFVH